MLSAEMKAKWVAALRSGEYKQCRHELFNGVGHCCIGVLARIQGKDDGWMRAHSQGVGPQLPSETCEWPSDWISSNAIARDFSGMNDAGRSFADIADEIEARKDV